MEDSITEAILAINPKAEVSVSANDINTIVWENDTTPISKADILAKQKELVTAYNKTKYQRDRATSYPAIADQLDMIYHAGVGGDAFQAAIKAIKDKHPKE